MKKNTQYYPVYYDYFFYGILFAHNEKEISNKQQISIKNPVTSDYSSGTSI